MTKRTFLNLQKARTREANVNQDQGYNNQTSHYGNSAFNTADTGPVVATEAEVTNMEEIKESVDLSNMGPMERKQLGEGKLVTVFIDMDTVCTIPHRLLMKTSTKSLTLLNSINEIHLPAGTDRRAVLCMADYILAATKYNKVFPVRLPVQFELVVVTCRVARMLSMFKYVYHVYMNLKKSIFNDGYPSMDQIKIVENGTEGMDDPFLLLVADRFAYLIRHDELDNEGQKLANNSSLALARVTKINNKYADRHRQYQERQALWEGRKQQRSSDKARRIQEAKDRQAAADAKKKFEKYRLGNPNVRAALLPRLTSNEVLAFTREGLEVQDYFRARGDTAFF